MTQQVWPQIFQFALQGSS